VSHPRAPPQDAFRVPGTPAPASYAGCDGGGNGSREKRCDPFGFANSDMINPLAYNKLVMLRLRFSFED